MPCERFYLQSLHPAQFRFPGNLSLQIISADANSQISLTASVKAINLSAILSVRSRCYADFVIGNHNWIQRCMVDPGANINCVSYHWITCFETPDWNYALECGSRKAAGRHSLDIEGRVLLKISWPQRTQSSLLISGLTLSMVKMELYFGTSVCRALGVIDHQWPLSNLTQNVKPSPSTALTLEADPVQPTPCIIVDVELLSETSNPEAILAPSDDDL